MRVTIGAGEWTARPTRQRSSELSGVEEKVNIENYLIYVGWSHVGIHNGLVFKNASSTGVRK